jgi:nucleotide-binding universal stress UspA family protein
LPLYEKILVALDFSDCASDVAEHAADVAAAFGASVFLLHVDQLPSGIDPHTRIRPGPAGAEVDAGEYLRDGSKKQLSRFTPFFEARGVSVQERVGTGKVADVILRAIDDVEADLVVMGTHGRRGLSRLMLGSVAEAVMRGAKCPVLTVRTVHKPSCDAANCNWCATEVTDEMHDVEAETVG